MGVQAGGVCQPLCAGVSDSQILVVHLWLLWLCNMASLRSCCTSNHCHNWHDWHRLVRNIGGTVTTIRFCLSAMQARINLSNEWVPIPACQIHQQCYDQANTTAGVGVRMGTQLGS